MHAHTLILLFAIVLITVNNFHSAEITSSPLFSTYSIYAQSTREAKTIVQLLKYQSEKRLKSIEYYFKQSDLNKSIATLSERLKFQQNIAKLVNNQEIIKKDRGCLLINGVTDKGDKVSVLIGYANEKNNWKIDSVSFEYHDTENQFISKAVCDDN